MNPVYRKTREDVWVVMGPTDVVLPGATVTVVKKDGTVKLETIARVGKPFDVDGTSCVYGYPQKKQAVAGTGSRRRAWRRPCGYPGCSPNYCDECDGEGG